MTPACPVSTGDDDVARFLSVSELACDEMAEEVVQSVLLTTSFVDSRYNATRLERPVTNSALGTNTLSLDLAGVSGNRDYLFARLGMKTRGVEEMIYTATKKIELNQALGRGRAVFRH